VAQLVAPLVSIHVVGLPDPCRLPYESKWNRSVDQQYVIFGYVRVINVVFVSTWWIFLQYYRVVGCDGIQCSRTSNDRERKRPEQSLEIDNHVYSRPRRYEMVVVEQSLTSHSTHVRMVLTANLLTVNSTFYRSNDPTNRVIALKDEDGRPDQASIPLGPHHHVTIIQQIICSVKWNRQECMQTHLITVEWPQWLDNPKDEVISANRKGLSFSS